MERSMARSAPKLNYDDLAPFPNDGKRHELIDGEHFVTPAPHLRHQRVLRNLNHRLDSFVRERDLGRVYFAPVDG